MLAVAVPIMLNMIADAFAPSTESENKEFFLVIATGFTAISDKLFDKGIRPSSKKFVKYFLWFKV